MESKKQSAESKIKEIRRHTRKKYSAEENNQNPNYESKKGSKWKTIGLMLDNVS